jgi:hypothetical protein
MPTRLTKLFGRLERRVFFMVPRCTIGLNALQTVEMFRRLGGQDEIYLLKIDRTMLERKIDSQSDPVFPLLRGELEIATDCTDRFAVQLIK